MEFYAFRVNEEAEQIQVQSPVCYKVNKFIIKDQGKISNINELDRTLEHTTYWDTKIDLKIKAAIHLILDQNPLINIKSLRFTNKEKYPTLVNLSVSELKLQIAHSNCSRL